MAENTKPLSNEEKADAERVQAYLACISQYDREFEKWHKRADKIIKRYRDDGRGVNGSSVRFNILWSNVQTLVPATFSRLPQPDVARRFRDNDPVGRVAALILERSLEYEVQHYPDYAASMKQSVLDRFLGGRGTTWVRYEPHFRAMSQGLPSDGVEVSEDVETGESAAGASGEADVAGGASEELDYECSPCDYVHPKDFGHAVARTWEEVTKVWRIVYMYEDAVKDRFGEELAKEIPYDSSPDKKDKYSDNRMPKQAKIYEIWDKEKKSALWLSKSLGKILDERDDPLKLTDFWPCPKPLFSTTTNDCLIPVPDFVLYQDQADELDTLSDRIDGLIRALQVKGTHDASVPELARLFTEATNTQLIPVKNWQAFVEKKGLQGAIDLIDLSPFAAALKEAYLAMSQVKEFIYEITGISDIVRGQSNANETLGAQEIKQNFVGLRLKTMQGDVALFATELLRIKAQIICAKYSPLTIAQISAADQLSEADQQYIQPAIALLVGEQRLTDPEADPGPNPMRSFRIEVAADSLVQMDENQEKMDRMEFLKAAGSFIKDALPVIQSNPQAAPLLVQMLKFGVTGFKVGKTIEGDFDQTLDQLKQAASQPQPPKPDPEMAKVEAQKAKDQMAVQAQQQKDAAELQAEQVRAQQEGALEVQRIQAESLARERELRMEAQMEQMRQQAEDQRAQSQAMMDAAFARFEALLKAETAIEVAQISAGATLDAAQISAAETATEQGASK